MSLIKEIDYGTPESKSERMVTLTIDGQSVTVPEGTSIMRAAMEIGTEIPKLCATDSIKAFGSCRLCLVEIEGRNGAPASCTTPVAPNIVVHTQTPRLATIRRGVMELYISDHPLDCLTCAANGDCELQDMAGAVGLRDMRYGYRGANHVFARNDGSVNFDWRPKDESNPYFTFDPAKCIVCNRCVRACEEVQGTFALTISGRGFDSRVAAGMSEAFFESECVSCGACVQACPTATLQEKSVIEIGLPEHSAVTTCAYCGVGCTFKAEMRGEQVVRMVPWKDGKANHGHSCIKGRFAYGYANHGDRVLNPMIREKISEPWKVVSWDEAISFTARRFKEIQTKYGRSSVGGITSSRCTNEESYLVQKLIRSGFGNNNVDTCARVCHSPTGYGLHQAFGTSAGTQDFDSVDEADVILIIGCNPTDAHPVFASRMKKRLREGAKLIIVDPRRIDLVRTPHVQADYHLPLRPGTNVAVVTAMAHVIVTEGLVNRVEVLRAGRSAEGLVETVAGRRVTDARAGVDVIVAKAGANKLLNQIAFFIGAARRGDAADRTATVFRLDFLEALCGKGDRLLPRCNAPRVRNLLADHRIEHAVAVVGVAIGEAALDAAVAVIGLAVLPGDHAHDFLAAHLGLEGAADAAIGASGDGRMFGLADLDDRILDQRRRGAGLNASAAGDAFRLHIALAHPRRDAAVEAAPLDRQRECALHLGTGAHAAVADDALRGVVGEIRVRLVLGQPFGVRLALVAGENVVLAVVTISHFAQTDRARHFLQLTIAVGRAGQAVERMVGDVKLHDPAPDGMQPRRRGFHGNSRRDRRRAGGGKAVAALDLDEAQAARAEGLDVVGRAELGDLDADLHRRAHDRRPLRDAYRPAVNRQGHRLFRHGGRRSVVDFLDEAHCFARIDKISRDAANAASTAGVPRRERWRAEGVQAQPTIPATPYI